MVEVYLGLTKRFSSRRSSIVVVVSGVLVVRMVSYSIIKGVGVGGGVPAAITIVVVLPSLLLSPLPLWWWCPRRNCHCHAPVVPGCCNHHHSGSGGDH